MFGGGCGGRRIPRGGRGGEVEIKKVEREREREGEANPCSSLSLSVITVYAHFSKINVVCSSNLIIG